MKLSNHRWRVEVFGGNEIIKLWKRIFMSVFSENQNITMFRTGKLKVNLL